MPSLSRYKKKRDFKQTPEPAGKKAKRKGFSFVVQKHAARRLHYDFRLELDGVLLSWAVPKGLSYDPDTKRLAVHVEDHPLEYRSFEGTIPKGEYGGGTVMVWDKGTWMPIEDPHRGHKKGHLHFELHGEKLRGTWHLVRRSGEDKTWFIFKGKDSYASITSDAELDQTSVKTGRTLEQIAEGKSVKKKVKFPSLRV